MMLEIDRSPRQMQGNWCRVLLPCEPYFVVSYPDVGVNLPVIETLVYLGAAHITEEAGGPLTAFVFQDAQSYSQDGDWSLLSEERSRYVVAHGSVMFYDADAVATIADIDGLLLLLSPRREQTSARL